jgi:hypothetical protein
MRRFDLMLLIVCSFWFVFCCLFCKGGVSPDLKKMYANVYSDSWQSSCPDLVCFIPEGLGGPKAENQHFIVIPLDNGEFFAVWTTGAFEVSEDMHVVYSKSKDLGRTWAEPKTLSGNTYFVRDGKKVYERRAAWGFPIYAPKLNRLYVFWDQDLIPAPRLGDSKAEMRFKFSEDYGETWSQEYVISKTTWDKPDWKKWCWIIWQGPVEIEPGKVIGCGTIWLRDRDKKEICGGSELWFWQFDNILTEKDPAKLTITMLPDGEHGVRRAPKLDSGKSRAQEPTVIRLGDGRWFCVFRTEEGFMAYTVSNDHGHTWNPTAPLRYEDNSEVVKQPLGPAPLYDMGNGMSILIFNNNDGYAKGDVGPLSWKLNRRPAFYSIGYEMLDKEQPIWFTPPLLLADNDQEKIGHYNRTSIAGYTSYFEYQDKRYFWYPDRKHFLLGKYITDEMVQKALDLSK